MLASLGTALLGGAAAGGTIAVTQKVNRAASGLLTDHPIARRTVEFVTPMVGLAATAAMSPRTVTGAVVNNGIRLASSMAIVGAAERTVSEVIGDE